MKKKSCDSAIIGVFLLLNACLAFGQVPKQVFVRGATAVVRVDPSTASRILARVRKDAVLDVYAYEPNTHWYLVKAAKVRGWIREASVLPVISTEQLPDIPESVGVRKPPPGWALIGTGASGTSYYQTTTIERLQGGILRIWQKLVAAGDVETVRQVALDCDRHRYVLLRDIVYEADGRVRSRSDFTGLATPQPIVPDSVMFEMAKAVCAKQDEIY